jgi:hypothetical protein
VRRSLPIVLHPRARVGVLFDQPHVTAAAQEGWQAHHTEHSDGVAATDRIEFVGGSFFDGECVHAQRRVSGLHAARVLAPRSRRCTYQPRVSPT